MITQWQPDAGLAQLRQRAALVARIRDFFAVRQVLEVDTPVLSHYGSSDPHIDSITAHYQPAGLNKSTTMYLASSPEYAMKRLVAAGSGCIYQITKAFRNGESGSHHNPEFTLLEWYRMDHDHHALMDEVEQLVQLLLGPLDIARLTYRQAFMQILQLDPFNITTEHLQQVAAQQLDFHLASDEPRDTWLDLLMSHCIEPALPKACFIHTYPASQAALARLGQDQDGTAVAHRFELYIDGLELANGYHELANANEQAQRFAQDQQLRRQLGKSFMAPDPRLLAALQSGLPDCAGVALGLDRLLMLVLQQQDINGVLSFGHQLA
jgi:elongation factor P--(R)-beta-lysine ligase